MGKKIKLGSVYLDFDDMNSPHHCYLNALVGGGKLPHDEINGDSRENIRIKYKKRNLWVAQAIFDPYKRPQKHRKPHIS